MLLDPISWLEYDTISWLEYDTISWLEYDTAEVAIIYSIYKGVESDAIAHTKSYLKQSHSWLQ